MTAPPDRVWALVSDVTRIGEFSPETFEAEWLDGATGPEPGARFRGHVRRNGHGPVYWTTCTVTAAEPGREFAFSVAGLGGSVANTWGYRLERAADGTDGTEVTEFFAMPPTLVNRIYWTLGGPARLRTNLAGMRATLERIKAAVEREQAG
jgi:polyketide cyclase/dehydrase/lipid transport protein